MPHDGDPAAPPAAITESQPQGRRDRVAAPSGAVLVVAHGGTVLNGHQRHALAADRLVVGREPGPGGVLLADPRVSRRHFAIRRAADGWEIEDPGSRNGTSVNGQPLTGARPLDMGDVIRAGDTLFVLAAASAGAPGAGDLGLVGESAALHGVREAIARVGGSATSVLIKGETGVGKELVARALHRCSGRAGPFLAVNCAAISEPLLESELFGHVRGAFTGATADRPGLFRAAHGGTLFLDEVGDMPPRLQVQLLRVLETRTVRPVGAWQELPTDVRVVAATHRDMIARVHADELRADLYARLAQWIIDVPPLRDRREDIPLLVRAILERHSAADRPVAVELVERLLLARWLLNVRGLANVVAAAILAGGPGQALELGPAVLSLLDSAERLAPPGAESGARSIEDLSDGEVRGALAAARGNVAAAARALGCTRQQLYRLLQSRGLDVESYRRP